MAVFIKLPNNLAFKKKLSEIISVGIILNKEVLADYT